MSQTILAQQEHSLTADTKLVVSHGTWRKKDYVDVRTYWRSPEDKWLPTKKGVRLGPDLARELTDNIREMLGVTETPTNGNGKSAPIKTPVWAMPQLHVIKGVPPLYFPAVPAGDITMMQHVAQIARALYFPVLAKPYDAVSPGLDYWTGTTSAGFPDRSAWPKNTKGGVKVSAYGMKRTRHDGVRCYGSHRGNKCIPFDFSECPSIPQAPYIPRWVSIVARLAESIAREIARVRYYNLDHQAA